ncbi:MAG: 2'-5' RNA ligase family protein [Bacteroidota bacterium]
MDKMNLYFIALIPHLSLRKEIKLLKEEIKLNYNAKHALKSPAHITLQMPFRKTQDKEIQLITYLEKFANKQNNFDVNLADFGCFSPRVIYITVENHKPIITLHKKLKSLLINQLEFDEKEINQKINPHLTLATRDLSKEMFNKAWIEYKQKKFINLFEVKSIFLLKHNGKNWDIFKEFLFKN